MDGAFKSRLDEDVGVSPPLLLVPPPDGLTRLVLDGESLTRLPDEPDVKPPDPPPFIFK